MQHWCGEFISRGSYLGDRKSHLFSLCNGSLISYQDIKISVN